VLGEAADIDRDRRRARQRRAHGADDAQRMDQPLPVLRFLCDLNVLALELGRAFLDARIGPKASAPRRHARMDRGEQIFQHGADVADNP